ncbi:MAG: competence damage-inducible protein A [Candidatus Mesenet longicola]|uniref:Competence damage-inducible protein A n=1 Tax=Candidatus Mesenet longicola TaxID=1892558 RepID=A0A8J3MMR3_9RICK|nr:MAG: competence damage-inducible protein A [Candidatus Mesenet longicola]GHM59432.1 MAG: competence damage-inducible protein A [Candidatus Mesenet longicola]
MLDQDILNKALACYKKIKESNFKIAIAESCSGGLLSFLFTTAAGASTILDCAFVTYSNDSKSKILGVQEETLRNYGAVSKEVANEMACGALLRSNANIAVAITGIAGPGGGSSCKPVGLVYISCMLSKVNIDCKEYHFNYDDRNKIQVAAADAALDFILDRVENA